MKFSIIVPIYKVEKYLHECIDSILHQTFHDYEIILVDDGSPDKCPQICDEYSEKYEQISVIHKQNGGISSARNAGLRVARGEYVLFIDSDDYYSGEQVLELLNTKCSGNTDVVLFGYKEYFDTKNRDGAHYTVYPQIEPSDLPEDVISKIIANDMFIAAAWTKAIKRELLINNQIEFKEELISGEDIDWYFNVMQYVHTFDTINEAFVVYRQREGSISHAPKLKSIEDNIWILEKWPGAYENTDLSDKYKIAMRKVFANYYGNLLILLSSYPSAVRKNYYDRVIALKHLQIDSITKRSLILKLSSSLLGIRGTVFLLSFAYKIVRRT